MNARRRAAVAVLALALASMGGLARADDVADEADLQFNLGAEAYQKGDFKGALEHFLASNRLVANRNVEFNVARTYERLQRYPDAYRWYLRALEGEPDAPTRERIEAALRAMSPNVAVLRSRPTRRARTCTSIARTSASAATARSASAWRRAATP